MSGLFSRQFAPLGLVAVAGVGSVLFYALAAPLPGEGVRTNINCWLSERDVSRLQTLADRLTEAAGIPDPAPAQTSGCRTEDPEVRLAMAVPAGKVAAVQSALLDAGCSYDGFSCTIPGDPAVMASVQPAAPGVGVPDGKLLLRISTDPARRNVSST